MVTGRGLRLRTVTTIALVTAGLGYLLLRWLHRHGVELTAPSWVSIVLLVFMAAGILFAGLPIRRALRGITTSRPLDPLRAFRTLVLAQAGALTGALVAGWYFSHAFVLIPDADAASVRTEVFLCAVIAVCGALLAGVGLWVQSMCRIDPPDDPVDDEPV